MLLIQIYLDIITSLNSLLKINWINLVTHKLLAPILQRLGPNQSQAEPNHLTDSPGWPLHIQSSIE